MFVLSPQSHGVAGEEIDTNIITQQAVLLIRIQLVAS